MNTDPFCDPEFQLDFQSGAYRQDLVGHGSVRVNLQVPGPGIPVCCCPTTRCLLHPGDETSGTGDAAGAA